MKQILIYGLGILFLISCASAPKSQHELENLVFVDTDIFDENLSNSMSVEAETITITTLAPTSINEIPTRLGKWLSIVLDKGGRVDVEPKPLSKSPTWLLSLLPMAYHFLKEEWAYGVTNNYNAKIFYHPDSGKIKQIVFSRKANH